MIKGAADGAIDFSEVDLLNRHWRIKLELLLKQLVDRDSLKYLEFLQLRHILYLGAGLTKEGWEKHQRWELDAFEDFSRLFLNLPEDNTPREERLTKALSDAWRRSFGDLEDPEVQNNIDAVATALRNQREQSTEAEHDAVWASNALQPGFGTELPVWR